MTMVTAKQLTKHYVTGDITVIGTRPGTIMALFLTEGLFLGIFSTLIGVVLSLISIFVMNMSGISFDFGRQKGLLLAPTISTNDVLIGYRYYNCYSCPWKPAACLESGKNGSDYSIASCLRERLFQKSLYLGGKKPC